jgi:preprotein translocase subunit SecG
MRNGRDPQEPKSGLPCDDGETLRRLVAPTGPVGADREHRPRTIVTAVRITLQVLLVITSLFLTLLILLHKGRGGGLSDMFGGGASSSMASSGVAERNLNRFTIAVGLLWATCIVLLGLVERFFPDGA